MSLFGDMILAVQDLVWKALADPTRRQILEVIENAVRSKYSDDRF